MRQEKQLLLDSISDAIQNSSAFVLTSYEKIDANMTADFRSDFVKSGGELLAVKKRVFLKAAASCGVDIDPTKLNGHIALAIMGEDYVDTTKKLFDFCDSNKELMQVLAGHFDGKIVSAQDVEQISKLPSKDEMRAQLLSLFEAPMADTVSVMHSLLTSVMHCLENKSQQDGAN